MKPHSHLLVFVATYNEAENVEALFHRIRGLNVHADILFLDDNSPDGTGKIIDHLVATNSNVYVIHRSGKQKKNYSAAIRLPRNLTCGRLEAS